MLAVLPATTKDMVPRSVRSPQMPFRVNVQGSPLYGTTDKVAVVVVVVAADADTTDAVVVAADPPHTTDMAVAAKAAERSFNIVREKRK